jgi:chlorobactene glucosyltransferase
VLLIILYLCLAGALFTLFMTVINLFTVKKLSRYPGSKESPFVSVIVPARNEERNIHTCISSLLQQDYSRFEIIVVNDHSEDRTGEILAKLKQEHPALIVLEPPVLPAGWLGKNWACHQGYGHARGELLLFTDADTQHTPQSLRNAVAGLLQENADFLTAIIFLTSISLAEKLIQPLLTCMIYAIFPFALMQKKKLSALSYAHGAYMLFRREAYDRIGGHAAISGNVFDDLTLAGNISRAGFQALVINGAGSISCRMYTSMHDIFAGFSKNLFRIASYKYPTIIAVPLFTLGLLLFAAIYSMPPFVLLACLSLFICGMPVPADASMYAGTAVLLTSISFFLVYKNFGYSLRMICTYPVQVVLFFIIAMNSMISTLRGKTFWKGRPLYG